MRDSPAPRFPFSPYPAGWYRVAVGATLAPGSHQNLRVFGEDLVLFRTAGGVPRLIAAHCPHLGSHLGEGGRVVGESIQCPLHGWHIDGAGQVVRVPYSQTLPRVCVRSWRVREVNGLIMAWSHPQDAEPTWEPPALAESTDPAWTGYLPGRIWRIRTHVQEFCENGADNAHSSYLHGQESVTRGVDIEGHVYTHRTLQRFRMFRGTKRWTGAAAEGFGREMEGSLDISCHGLGMVVERGSVTYLFKLDYSLLFLPVPVDAEHIELHSMLAIRRLPTGLLTRLVWRKSAYEIGVIIDEDVPIWESKQWRARPVLLPEDGPIRSFRSWARQFYPAATSHEPT